MSISNRKVQVLSRCELFGTAVMWGSSFFITKGAVDYLPPATLQAVRFSISALLLGIIFHRKVMDLTIQQWRRGLVIGFCLAAASLVQNVGIQNTTPGKNAFLTAVYCVIVPFLFWIVKKERPQMKRFVAAFMCLFGIGLVSLTQSLTIGRGDLLTLIGGFLYAVHIVAIDRLGEGTDSVALCVMQFAVSALFSWIYGLIFEGNPASFEWDVWPQVLYLSIVCTALGFLFQIMGQKHTPPSAASLIMSLESVFGVFFSVLFYAERMTLRLALGFAVIFLSIVISEVALPQISLSNRKKNRAYKA